uniref:CCHC-type domain-containing protein n=1 Tax=Trichuris muris TaxID=70415 RepID=A0A5S6QP14_TRIMR
MSGAAELPSDDHLPTSYRGHMDGSNEGSLDLRLIPEFDGSPQQSVTEWFQKVELICKLRRVDNLAEVVPLRLTGGAFAVYMEMPDEDKLNAPKVKKALLTSFAMDPFAAYEAFVARRLRAGETPDVFLAELRRLAYLFGGMAESALLCAFVAGLPESVRQLLRAGTRLEDLNLCQVLARARAVLTDERPAYMENACMGGMHGGPKAKVTERRCFACNGFNHIARDCPTRQQKNSPGGTDARRPNPRNRRRNGKSPAVAQKQGNGRGEEA